MKILDQIGHVRDVEQNVGHTLIAAGVASLYTPAVKPNTQPDTKWTVGTKPSLRVGNETLLPEAVFIHAFCRSCSSAQTMSGPNVFKTATFKHCGIEERPPEDIVSAFLKLRKKRAQQTERPKQEVFTPPAFLQHI